METTVKITTTTTITENLMPSKFEPQKSNLFIIDIPGVDCFSVVSVEMPVLQPTFPTPGFEAVSDLVVTFTLPIEPNISQQLAKFHAGAVYQEIQIKFLDKVGTVIELWKLQCSRIKQIELSPLVYVDSNLTTNRTAKVTFNISEIKQEF